MDLKKLKLAFASKGCNILYIKVLSANDNSKNQIYFGGSFEILNILPIKQIIEEPPGSWNKERFKAALDFFWLNDEGLVSIAPGSQLVLYPKYPEVRFSGFLKQCQQAPNELLTQRLPGRLLFLGVNNKREIIGYVSSPESLLANEFNALSLVPNKGVFSCIDILNTREILFNELTRIHKLGWIDSKQLNNDGSFSPCQSSNCGGFTLEAELGIQKNSNIEPDFMGWEIKQYTVKDFSKINSNVITLFTPNPDGGLYYENGMSDFTRKYGYPDIKGRTDRINFGGTHKVGNQHNRTKLTLTLEGFDTEIGKITNTKGKLLLVDQNENIAASWSYGTLLKKWNTKHNQACFVPSLKQKGTPDKYSYSKIIKLGTGTDFQLFLSQIAKGIIYYDPGIKIEGVSTNKPNSKARNQFRIKCKDLNLLYYNFENVSLF